MRASSSETSVLLVRHGETKETAERRFPGGDLPLTDRGRAQAVALAGALRGTAIDAAFASESQRARETAEILCAGRELSLQVLPTLGEMRFGRLGGLTVEAAAQAFPDLFTRWQTNPFEVTPPDAEPFLDFVGRVRRIRRELSRAWAGRTIVVVTHGGVIAVWRCLEEGRPWEDFWESIPAPGTGIWLIRAEGQVRIETLRPEG
ncbi:MAG: histidine phosphatase family protein [Nitrospinae bacterium]|nr:histidine phosphatase family protein [Nitrospinota bacterium]